MDDAQASVEAAIRVACDAGEHGRAATLALEHYGSELYGYLFAQLGDRNDADDVFAQFSEELWKSLSHFEWRCRLRTWAYKLARRAASQQRRRDRRRVPQQPLPSSSRFDRPVEVVSHTPAWQSTAVKDRFRGLLGKLSHEDRTLLILRVDRGLAWLELAEVMLDDEHGPEPRRPEQLQKEAARLRKRYQIAKDRLRKLSQKEGLLDT